MAIINLDDLRAGMCVADAVKAQGRIIVGANVELSDKIIHLFKAWGVTEVSIKDDSIEDNKEQEEPIPEDVLAGIEQNLKNEFKFVDTSDEIANEIMRISRKKRIEAWRSKEA